MKMDSQKTRGCMKIKKNIFQTDKGKGRGNGS